MLQENSNVLDVYIIETFRKYDITSARKINKVRLKVEVRVISDRKIFTTTVQVMNQSGTKVIIEAGGGNGYKLINEAIKEEKVFGRCVKKCKRQSGTLLSNKCAKSTLGLLKASSVN
jgi:hypothetical protein